MTGHPLERRLREIRAVLMREPELRAGAEALVNGLLLELEGRDDDELVEELGGQRVYGPGEGMPALTVAEVRDRLRVTLEELAAADG